MGKVSEITGNAYGAGGAAGDGTTAGSATANTGNGGKGGRNSSNSTYRKGGNGGSGIVVVRLKDAYALADVTLTSLSLAQSEMVSSFADASTGSAVEIRYGQVGEMSFSVANVARAERTKDGAFAIVGMQPGTTRATFGVMDAEAKVLTAYTVDITVSASVDLQDVSLQRGETVTAFRRKDTGAAISFDSADVKALLSSVSEIAELVRLPDGRVGVIGKLGGTTDVMIVKAGQSYACSVTVEALLNGSYKAGAYEVAVTNASEVKYVDGDLVISYLDTNAAVTKSFTLPKETAARLLAVGGGGAGGQDASYSTSVGLPGGGGAGGMVTNSQDFVAALYQVTVGAGGLAHRSLAADAGANGGDTVVKRGSSPVVTAKGGGGGGQRSKNNGVGNSGGCGGGGSYSSGGRSGGSSTQSSPGIGSSGGLGGNAKFGAGGGGAGGSGTQCNTTSSSSGAGGPGLVCDITGAEVEYARGGAGGAARPNGYYYYDETYGVGVKHPTDKSSVSGKNVYLWEAEDGKPGRNGYGDGGGGGGHYGLGDKNTGTASTYAGSGGSGIVVVRIPPYKTSVEDALKAAFAGQPATVSGPVVTLTGAVAGPIRIPDNLGSVSVDLNGHHIVGTDGAAGDDITAGGDGQSALAIVSHAYDCEAGAATKISVTGTGSLQGGVGGTGHPAGHGAEALEGDSAFYDLGGSVTCGKGADGAFIAQHPHVWAYTIEDGRIVATCVADDGVECSYRTRKPYVAISANDAAYTSFRYDQLSAVNGITPVTGIVVSPETYVGRDGTDYPESSTPPSEQGAYTVKMSLGGLEISSDFYITEPKPSQDRVYQSWKTAERRGRDVRIYLSATFDGSKTINDGNILLLGSRCNAHSMATGTVEKSINALTKYANVRWYAYGSRDPTHNLTNQLTPKGETVAFKESGGKVTGETVHLEGGNHFVHKEMMDDLYAELVEKRNRDDGYDLLILEFDGDLLGRYGESPYQLVYSLPEGWTEEKATLLRQAMSRYYAEDRVVWIVPDVNKKKSDSGWTGEYPWTSNPDFVWQRAFLNASETEGYRNPLQKNYEDADELVGYLQEVLVGHFFSMAIIKDALADGLTLKSVTPQMRGANGIWNDFGGGPVNYSIHEPRSDTMVTADVVTEGAKKVTATFDMRDEQAWACANNVVLGDDFRLVIDAELDGFFSSGTGGGEEQETNDGPATFIFSESNLQGEENYSITNTCASPSIKNVKLTPVYSAEDVVKTYDGRGTNIVVKPVDPAPGEAVVRYSLDERGVYADTLSLTEVCDRTKVWFEIVDKLGDFNTVTNFATVTILPAPHRKQEGVTSTPYSGPYDGAGHTISVDPDGGSVTYLVGGAWVPDPPLYTNRVDATDVVFRVTKEGHDDFEGTNTVTVTRREATLTSGTKTDFPYDGTPHAYTNLTVSGFVEGEGLASTSAWTTVTDVSEGEVANAFAYGLLPNTLADNYEIAVVTGKVAVVPAPVSPKNPGGTDENPDDEPQPDEGVVLWARNVVKTYDGVGTNVVAGVYSAVDGNGFAYEYSVDGTSWVSDLAFTNVTEGAQKVYFRAVPEGADPNYAGATAFAYVTVLPRPVTVSFSAADKVYDGTVAATCTATNFADVAEGEGFALDVSAMTFAFDTPDVGADKTVTATGYDDALVVPLEGTLKSNYAFAFVPTTTASITNARQTGVTSDPYSGPYDGAGHTISVDPDGGSVTYLVGGSWIPDPPLYTNRVDATDVVFRVTKEGYDDFEGTNTVTVTRREATLTSGTKTDFTYDGTPHAYTNLTVSGFVEGEGLASTSGWATVVSVAEGEVANAFAYGLLPNTLADNYEIAVVTGKVAVVPAPVVPKSPGGTDENPGDEPQPDEGVVLWARNVVKTYDGVGTNVLAGVYSAAEGNGFAYEYSVDGTSWVSDLAFTNVTEGAQKVYFRAVPEGTGPNYAGATAFAYVTVLPREVTVSFSAADKVYDGTVAATCTATNFADVAEGEGFALDVSAMTFAFDTPGVGADKTVTATGYDDALVVPLEGTLKSNYAFAFVPTTTASITNAKQTGVTSDPYSAPYDGAGHTISVDPDGGTVTYLVGGAWVPGPPLYTNRVDATDVVFRVTKEGHDDFEGTNTVTVTRREATLTSGTKTDFTYDGTPHAYTNLTVSGFVEGEGLASTSAWATVVSVAEGEVANVFAYGLKPNTLADNYDIAVVTGKVAVVSKLIGPDPSDSTKPADPEIVIQPLCPQVYDGRAKEPEVVVTNVHGTATGLVEGVDFEVDYFDNTNATEEAYAVITGVGNYGGVFTNVFAILPREVTLCSGTKTMYLDPERPGEPVTCSNGLVWVALGSFVTNAVTGELDGFEATVTGRLEGSLPTGPVSNDFTAVVKPGLETNYFFTLIPGELAILGTPTNVHEEVHEVVPSGDGEGVLDIVMDNHEAGKYATDRPPELNEVGELVEKTPREDVEIRLLVSTNYLEKSFGEVTNEVVAAARDEGKSEREIKNYTYDALDIAVNETRWCYEKADDEIPTNIVTRDIGNEIGPDHMMTITIPYEFNPKLIEFSVWRNHTNDSSGVSHEGVVELPYSDTPIAETETWKTNAASVILRVHKFSVYVFKTLVLSTPQLTGRVEWKYSRSTSVFYAGLDVSCTNGDKEAIRDLSFVFQDRNNPDGGFVAYLCNTNTGARLSDTSPAGYSAFPGEKFAVVALPEVQKSLREAPLGDEIRYGVSRETFNNPTLKNIVPKPERLIALEAAEVGRLALGDPEAVNQALCYITWRADGDDRLYWCALGPDLPLVSEAVLSSPAPMPVLMFNRALGYGLPPTTLDSDPALKIAAFEVNGRLVCGRVETVGAAGASGVPGPNARLEILGASEISGTFTAVAAPELAGDGSFSFLAPEGVRFFKARLTVCLVVH